MVETKKVNIIELVKPREGWLVLLALAGVVLVLVKSLADANWVPGDSAFLGLGLAAALVCGLILAKLPFPGWLSLGIGLVTGVEACYVMAAQALPRRAELWKEAQRLIPWLGEVFYGHITLPVPFFSPLAQAYSRAVGFFYRIIWWYQAGMAGKESRDEVISWFILATLLWGVSFFAGFWLFRSHRVLEAVLPLAIFLTGNVFYITQPPSYIIAMLGCILFLLLMVNFSRLEERWRRRRIAYSDQVRLESLIVGLVCIGAVMLVAWFPPVITSSRAYYAFWRRFGTTWGKIEGGIDRLLVERPAFGPALVSASTGLAGSGVPSDGEHELGGPVLPGKDEVMRVWTDDLSILDMRELEGDIFSLPKRYWRALTYDVYTGRSWQNSHYGNGDIQAGKPIVTEKDQRLVSQINQKYTLYQVDGLLYAVNEPLSADKPVLAEYRTGWDFTSARIAVTEYTVRSQVVRATVAELRNAPTRYPEWIERYLALPQTVPTRVKTLAQEVTRGADNPYDKALAIEAYLRTFSYDTNVPETPAGRDAAEHFLFDLKKGYCDHFATAMVVLARSAKVPARLAVGYATGELDVVRSEYIVREQDAHAWVEVYFPGYGWVEFEPTSNRGRFERPTTSLPSDSSGSTTNLLSQRPGLSVDIEASARIIGLAALAGVVIWALAWLWRERMGRLPPRDFVRTAYSRLSRRSQSLGLGPRDGQTPGEYMQFLAGSLEARARLVPVLARWPRWDEGELAQDVEKISSAYVRSVYSPYPVGEDELGELADSWRRLRRRLLFMRLRGKK